MASEGLSQNDMDSLDEGGYEDIKIIVEAVHQAYIQATTRLFGNVARHCRKNRYVWGRFVSGSLIKIKVQ